MNSVATPRDTQDRVFDIIFKEDELNWKDVLFDLVRSEGMDPWDINVSQLAEKFLDMLNKLKEMDFRVSGKMVLAASLFLKIKSDKLLSDGIEGLDKLINGPEEIQEDLLEDGFEFEQYDINQFLNDQKSIVPRTPQPRERKVSVFDLVDALEQALETDMKRQRVLSNVHSDNEPEAPKKSFDLTKRMAAMQEQMSDFFKKKTKTKVFFHDLVPSKSKEDMVYTFLPLLHLENARVVDLLQEEHFGDIEVHIHDHKLDEVVSPVE
ncbi:MAG: segregation/condensation protein A [Nanoarchaeota archaeon]|nr:segregation/condensation protein A [Nanoarchaeota archaeon]